MKNVRTRIAPIALALPLALGLCGLTACTDLEHAREVRDEAGAVKLGLSQEAEALERALRALPPDDPARAPLEDRLETTRKTLGTLEAGIEQLDAGLGVPQTMPGQGVPPSETGQSGPKGGSPDPGEAVGSLVTWASGLVPEPYRAPLVLGGALAAMVFRARRLKAGLKSVARGMEVAMRDDPVFKERFKANAGTFRSVQTPLAKSIVDEVQKPGVAWPI